MKTVSQTREELDVPTRINERPPTARASRFDASTVHSDASHGGATVAPGLETSGVQTHETTPSCASQQHLRQRAARVRRPLRRTVQRTPQTPLPAAGRHATVPRSGRTLVQVSEPRQTLQHRRAVRLARKVEREQLVATQKRAVVVGSVVALAIGALMFQMYSPNTTVAHHEPMDIQVRTGESLYSIAAALEINADLRETVEAIANANADTTTLRPGQYLTIPAELVSRMSEDARIHFEAVSRPENTQHSMLPDS